MPQRSSTASLEADSIVSRVKFWIGTASAVAAIGFGAAMYLNRYASAAEFLHLSERHDELTRNMSQHVAQEGARMSGFESTLRDLHDDFHYQRDQLEKIADKVGAAHAPIPKH